MIACISMALVLAEGHYGLGSLWLPEGQFLGHTTTSNH